MKYEAVIFDLFGTLVNNYPYEEYQNIRKRMASILEVPFVDFRKLWSETHIERNVGAFSTAEANLEFICKKLGINVDDAQIRLATKVRSDFIANVMKPQQATIDVLSRLKSVGLKIGLVSNCTPGVPMLWENLPFAPLFDVAVFSCSVGFQKPDPRIYQLAVEQLGINSHSCLYIGDGDSQELSGASRVGMNPVLIRLAGEDGNQPHLVNREEWEGKKISSLKEVLDLY